MGLVCNKCKSKVREEYLSDGIGVFRCRCKIGVATSKEILVSQDVEPNVYFVIEEIDHVSSPFEEKEIN